MSTPRDLTSQNKIKKIFLNHLALLAVELAGVKEAEHGIAALEKLRRNIELDALGPDLNKIIQTWKIHSCPLPSSEGEGADYVLNYDVLCPEQKMLIDKYSEKIENSIAPSLPSNNNDNNNNSEKKLNPLAFSDLPFFIKLREKCDSLCKENNYEKAVQYSQLGIDLGDIKAKTNLAYFYLKGRGGIEKDKKQGEKYLRESAEQGHVRAQINLARLLEASNRKVEAMKWYESAAKLGEPKAKMKWAEHLESTGQKAEAMKFYRDVAEAGQVQAQIKLAGYFEAEGNTAEAAKWREKIAAAQEAKVSAEAAAQPKVTKAAVEAPPVNMDDRSVIPVDKINLASDSVAYSGHANNINRIFNSNQGSVIHHNKDKAPVSVIHHDKNTAPSSSPPKKDNNGNNSSPPPLSPKK